MVMITKIMMTMPSLSQMKVMSEYPRKNYYLETCRRILNSSQTIFGNFKPFKNDEKYFLDVLFFYKKTIFWPEPQFS